MARPIRVANRSGSSTPRKVKKGIARRNEITAAEIWTTMRHRWYWWKSPPSFPWHRKV